MHLCPNVYVSSVRGAEGPTFSGKSVGIRNGKIPDTQMSCVKQPQFNQFK